MSHQDVVRIEWIIGICIFFTWGLPMLGLIVLKIAISIEEIAEIRRQIIQQKKGG